MKVYFKHIDNPSEVIEARKSTIVELPLPQSVLLQLEQDLTSSHNILPEPARNIQDWLVGLLDRFDPLVEDAALSTVLSSASDESTTTK